MEQEINAVTETAKENDLSDVESAINEEGDWGFQGMHLNFHERFYFFADAFRWCRF